MNGEEKHFKEKRFPLAIILIPMLVKKHQKHNFFCCLLWW